MKKLIVVIICFVSALSFAQKDNQSKTNFKVTDAVVKQRAQGYPIRVLEKLPLVKGCEALAEDNVLLSKCMKDQLNFIFANTLKGVETVAQDKRGVSIYVEFVIGKDGQLSSPQRVKVSEQILDEFTRKRFDEFKNKVNKENLIIEPGRVHDKDVNTLYGVKFIKSFRK